ncbi:hypothetical protein QBC33DRAFT_13986 [Phialemonium atrogriseum]|uniref:Uncharacterized protein n=1 Tax=Phialemonium atrogriseum TaxID=1093897 RepID=A0AAJ0FTV9_9PEZI|nr:uncharacterized protein QBC33DRAFT_13986 [Phialemonium atrogriseum]KAK1772530.1 hypothetical protein QBC33DRAFT_13986 [Phialemonium atrogriseum]
MAGDSVQYYCIKEPCCRLCQFQLEDGEFVVAAIEDDHVSASFSFRRHDRFEDDEEAITFHMCCESACIKGECRVHCFHDACYRFKLFLITSKYLAATEYSFSLPVRDGLKRRGRIQRTFAKKLKLAFLNQLPQEICHMVAGYLVRECAIVTSQELALDVSAFNSLVDLSHDVYAQYVRIEGVLYLRSLHNKSFSEGKGENVRVFKACSRRPIRNIYIRYDYIGVGHIVLFCHRVTSMVAEYGGQNCLKKAAFYKSLHKQILKVRRLLDPTDSTSKCDSTATPPGWPTPGLACRVIYLETCKIARGEINGLRMSFFDCNRPGTEGYSAAICGFHLSKLYAHHSATCTRFYEELDTVCSDMLWVYMPIDQDEYLKEVWVIRHPGAGFLALMVRLNSVSHQSFGSNMVPLALD